MTALRAYSSFASVILELRDRLRDEARLVHAERWQGRDVSRNPDAAMHEVLDVAFRVALSVEDLAAYRVDIAPNLPWADDHFLERVGGEPLNPGVQWANWPWGKSADTFRKDEVFSHSYMERYWPKYANRTRGGILQHPMGPALHGVRYGYGDLGDVVAQLAREPTTRQAILPVWFPEDTGGVHGGRLPCSIAYHFMLRRGCLSCTYWLRSCDFLRHFRDDMYLTVRLLLWVLAEARKLNPVDWDDARPGNLVVHISNLHVFHADHRVMFKPTKNVVR